MQDWKSRLYFFETEIEREKRGSAVELSTRPCMPTHMFALEASVVVLMCEQSDMLVKKTEPCLASYT